MPRLALIALVFALGPCCGATLIPNTDVEDNGDNRAVVDFMEQYRHAVEERNVGKILRLASRNYFDENGTPTGDDDLDYDGLAHALQEWPARLLAVRYEIRYRRITFRDNGRVYVEMTYTSNFRYATPDGGRWERRLADHRMVLERDHGSFKILHGM